MARQRPAIGMGLLLLAAELYNVGCQHIPPVTLFTVAGQVLLFLGFIPVSWSHHELCISAEAILRGKDYRRLLISTFEHSNDMHLYYNMASFLIKGRSLERKFGSGYFLFLIAVFSVLTNVMYVLLSKVAAELLDYSYMYSCAIGFSGVLFALKVLTTHYYNQSGTSHYFFMSFPTKYAVWFELLLIQLLIPRASFVGHLAGILVGLLYIKGPLKYVMDAVAGIVRGPVYTYRSQSRYRDWGSGTTGEHGRQYSRWNDMSQGSHLNTEWNSEYEDALRRSRETAEEERMRRAERESLLTG